MSLFNPEHIYEGWTPAEGLWSKWVKPALFASAGHYDCQDAEWRYVDVTISNSENSFYLIDLAGDRSVGAGLMLLRSGYQPVPLFNSLLTPGEFYQDAAVDMRPILNALAAGETKLREVKSWVDYRPAFLLDSRRGQRPRFNLHAFDNRSLCWPSDFPSGNFLRGQKLNQVIIVTERGAKISEDLQQAVLDWKRRAGIVVYHQDGPEAMPKLATLRPTWIWTELKLLLWSNMALFPNPGGGYGGYPEHGSAAG